jgi:hypothetical protein
MYFVISFGDRRNASEFANIDDALRFWNTLASQGVNARLFDAKDITPDRPIPKEKEYGC